MSSDPRSRSHAEPVRIGWNEYVALPRWGIGRLRAKVDTGARTSALHVENIELRPGAHVRFDVVLHRRRPTRVRVETRIRRRARVRSSTGRYQQRIFVATQLVLGPIRREIELSLVDRERMVFRMLLGRTALHGVLIDPQHRALLGRPARTPRRAAQKGPGS